MRVSSHSYLPRIKFLTVGWFKIAVYCKSNKLEPIPGSFINLKVLIFFNPLRKFSNLRSLGPFFKLVRPRASCLHLEYLVILSGAIVPRCDQDVVKPASSYSAHLRSLTLPILVLWWYFFSSNTSHWGGAISSAEENQSHALERKRSEHIRKMRECNSIILGHMFGTFCL